MSASIEKAKKRLEDAKVFSDVSPLWATLNWIEKPTQMTALEAEYYAPGIIIVYPGTGQIELAITAGRLLGAALSRAAPPPAEA